MQKAYDIFIKDEGAKERHVKFISDAAKKFAAQNSIPNTMQKLQEDLGESYCLGEVYSEQTPAGLYEVHTTKIWAKRIASAAQRLGLTIETF